MIKSNERSESIKKESDMTPTRIMIDKMQVFSQELQMGLHQPINIIKSNQAAIHQQNLTNLLTEQTDPDKRATQLEKYFSNLKNKNG